MSDACTKLGTGSLTDSVGARVGNRHLGIGIMRVSKSVGKSEVRVRGRLRVKDLGMIA